jgi:hypothetical protein
MVQAAGYAAVLPPETAVLAFAAPTAISASIAQASLLRQQEKQRRHGRNVIDKHDTFEDTAKRRHLLLRRYVLGLITSASLQRLTHDAQQTNTTNKLHG